MLQISDQRYSKPLPGSLVFKGSKSLVQYVVIDYTIKGYNGVNSDTELVEVGINNLLNNKLRQISSCISGDNQTWAQAIKPDHYNLPANGFDMCNSILYQLLSSEKSYLSMIVGRYAFNICNFLSRQHILRQQSQST